MTEEEALFVASKSHTQKAEDLVQEMIHVFTLARKGLLPGQDMGALKAVVEDMNAIRANQVQIGLIMQEMQRQLLLNVTNLEKLHQHTDEIQAETVKTMRAIQQSASAAEKYAFTANDACIGRYTARQDICGMLNEITALRLRFDTRSKRSIRKWLEVRLRNTLELPQGVAFDQLLKARMPQVKLALKEMFADAKERAELHAGKKPEPVQVELFPDDKKPEEPAPDYRRSARSSKMN